MDTVVGAGAGGVSPLAAGRSLPDDRPAGGVLLELKPHPRPCGGGPRGSLPRVLRLAPCFFPPLRRRAPTLLLCRWMVGAEFVDLTGTKTMEALGTLTTPREYSSRRDHEAHQVRGGGSMRPRQRQWERPTRRHTERVAWFPAVRPAGGGRGAPESRRAGWQTHCRWSRSDAKSQTVLFLQSILVSHSRIALAPHRSTIPGRCRDGRAPRRRARRCAEAAGGHPHLGRCRSGAPTAHRSRTGRKRMV